MISWLMSVFLSAFSLPSLRSRVTLLCALLLLSCSPSTDSDSTNNDVDERERIEVSGPISEDAVWESGKEYYVTGDLTIEAGATLTIHPDVAVKFAHERADDYYGIMVGGTLIADGEDSTTAILFTPLDKLLYPTGFTSGAAEWARKPGDWRGIEVEASSDTSSVIRYCRIAAGGTSLTL